MAEARRLQGDTTRQDHRVAGAPRNPRSRAETRREQPAPARPAWFTVNSLAAYLQVSDRMIRKWVSDGRLRSYKIDGCRRFDPADVDSFLGQFVDDRRIVA